MSEMDIEHKRLYWHSRRGMLELDVLLLGFLEEAYADLDPVDQASYRKLLDCEDNVMFSWFMRQTRPEEPDLARIVDLILTRVRPSE